MKRKTTQLIVHLYRRKMWQILNSQGDLECKFAMCSEFQRKGQSLQILTLWLTKLYVMI